MTYIGETNYCAQVIGEEEFQTLNKKHYIFCIKFIDDPKELRSKIVGLAVRVTVQLEQLGLAFSRKKNTRILKKNIIHFYLYEGNFYATMTGRKHGSHSCEELALMCILHNIIQDVSRPLYKMNLTMQTTKNLRKFIADFQDTFGNEKSRCLDLVNNSN